MFYTYSIKNLENGKFYIGSRTAKCMLTRKPEDDLGVKYFSSSKDKELRQAIKDGKVKYTVLQEYDDAKVCWRTEQQLIALYWKFFGKDMSYNHSCVNCNGEVIFSTSGKHLYGEKNPMFGKQHSIETKEKISASKKGEKNPMFGKQHSEETKEKLRKPNKKFYWKTTDDETKIMAKANAIQHHPDWILIGPVE